MKPHWYIAILKRLPESVGSYGAKKIVNYYLNRYANVRVRGIEKIQDVKSPILFICNHLSNSDGLVLNRVLKDEDVTFVAGVKLSEDQFTNMGRYVVKTLSIKPNSADKDAISSIIKTLKDGHNVFIFPEGTRSRTGSMNEAKKGITLIQKLSKAALIPVGIWGSEKLLPINDTGMGNEKFDYADVNVSFGNEIQFPERAEGEAKHDYEDRILTYAMQSISELLPEKYRGFYSKNKQAAE